MTQSIGDKKQFAIEFEVSDLSTTKGTLWGGLCLWIGGAKYGDSSLYTYLYKGNNYDMIMQLSKINVPDFPQNVSNNDTQFFDNVIEGYFGDPPDEISLKDVNARSAYWRKYILSPNGEPEFDNIFICYYKLNDKVRILCKRNEWNELKYIDISMEYLDFITVQFELILQKNLLKYENENNILGEST